MALTVTKDWVESLPDLIQEMQNDAVLEMTVVLHDEIEPREDHEIYEGILIFVFPNNLIPRAIIPFAELNKNF